MTYRADSNRVASSPGYVTTRLERSDVRLFLTSQSSTSQIMPVLRAHVVRETLKSDTISTHNANEYDHPRSHALPTTAPPIRIYSARELLRRAQEPGPFHNFPESFNDEIFAATRTVISENYVLYTKRGAITLPGKPIRKNGKIVKRTPARVVEGTYEISVRPSANGRVETITHRFFRSDTSTVTNHQEF